MGSISRKDLTFFKEKNFLEEPAAGSDSILSP